jgi:hypothetical protein
MKRRRGKMYNFHGALEKAKEEHTYFNVNGGSWAPQTIKVAFIVALLPVDNGPGSFRSIELYLGYNNHNK